MTRSMQRIGLGVSALLVACGTTERPGVLAYPDGGSRAEDGLVGFAPDGGADAGQGGPAADGATGGPDSEAADGGPASPYKLVFAMSKDHKDDFGGVCDQQCALQIHQNGLRNLMVALLRDGQPVPDDELQFRLGQPTDTTYGAVLVEHALTDEQGVATSQVKTTLALGQFDIIVSAPAHPEVAPIAFSIHVVSKAKGPLQLTMLYLGANNPLELVHNKFRLTLQAAPGQPACPDIDLGSSQLPKAQWESPPNMVIGMPWAITYPSFVGWVKKEQLATGGQPLRFTVLALSAKKAGGPVMAGGCVDTGATVTWNPTTQTLEGDDVYVTLRDIPPRLAGTYKLTTYLDLLSILPDPVELVFKTIFDIITDPIAGTLALACKLGGSSLDSFCGLVFEDVTKPDIKHLKQPFGALIVKFLNAILYAALPKEVQVGLDTGADLGAILTNLELGGLIEIKKEPDSKGFLSKSYTRDELTTITYRWSLGQSCSAKDPKCGKKSFAITQFQKDAVVGHFDLWRNAVLSRVRFAKHGLKIMWGALVNFLVQKQLLPLLMNPKSDPTQPTIDSWEKLIKSLLAGKQCLWKDTCCEDFGNKLAAQQSLVKAPFLAGVCETLIKLGTQMLDAQINSLATDTGNGETLTLWTDKCPLFEVDGDQYIDAIGSKVEFCSWNMEVKLGGKPQSVDAKFFAVRAN